VAPELIRPMPLSYLKYDTEFTEAYADRLETMQIPRFDGLGFEQRFMSDVSENDGFGCYFSNLIRMNEQSEEIIVGECERKSFSYFEKELVETTPRRNSFTGFPLDEQSISVQMLKEQFEP